MLTPGRQNTTSTPLYGDAPSVSTQAHNEGSHNDVFSKYFGLWMNQQANIGGMTQLWTRGEKQKQKIVSYVKFLLH